MDYPGMNLKGLLLCGQCGSVEDLDSTSVFRLVRKERGSYYYLDQRHSPHQNQRTNVPSWLVHRLITRVLRYSQENREKLLSRHSRGVPYKLSYPDQDRLDLLLSQRKEAIQVLDHDRIEELNKTIRLELDRQHLVYQNLVRTGYFNPLFLQSDQEIPTSEAEFEKLVSEVIPRIYIYGDSIHIHTNFAMAFLFIIPERPRMTNDINTYPMDTLDVANELIGKYLKQKYGTTEMNTVSTPVQKVDA